MGKWDIKERWNRRERKVSRKERKDSGGPSLALRILRAFA
jgi:hypothetical protein